MNEAPENFKTPSQRLFENVVNNNDEFIDDLEAASDLAALREVLAKHTYVDPYSDRYFYHVTDPGTDKEDIWPHFVFELDEVLAEFQLNPPTEAEKIDSKVKHPYLNEAVKRILKFNE